MDMPSRPETSEDPADPRTARRLPGAEDHDLALIVERLAWTPEQRLDANTAFVRFYLGMRPEGPLIEAD